MSYRSYASVPTLHLPGRLISLLAEAAAESARLARASLKRRAPKRGLTLMPGADTPLWNELVREVVPLLRKRGRKVHLARPACPGSGFKSA